MFSKGDRWKINIICNNNIRFYYRTSILYYIESDNNWPKFSRVYKTQTSKKDP